MKQIPKYFLQGLLYVVPITISIYVVFEIIYLLDGILELETPGVNILLMFSGITLAGYLGSSILSSSMEQLLKYGERVILRIPLVKIIYTAMKDLIKAFMGKEKTFNKPVLVRLSKESNIEKIGFITRASLTELGIKEGKVAVYLPHSYAFSGNMFIVDAENVTPINASSAEVMKLIVSGGVASVGQSEDKDNAANGDASTV